MFFFFLFMRYYLEIERAKHEFRHAGKTAKKWGQKSPDAIYADRNQLGIKTILRLILPARCALSRPPLGPGLGLYGIPIMKFLSRFNDVSRIFKEGTLLVVLLLQLYDTTYHLVFLPPPTTFLLKRVTGLKKGSGRPGLLISRRFLFRIFRAFSYYNVGEMVNKYKVDRYSYLEKERKQMLKAAELPKKKKKKRGRIKKNKGKFMMKVKRGRARFKAVTPELVYEICKYKYFQFRNAGIFQLYLNIDPSKEEKLTATQKAFYDSEKKEKSIDDLEFVRLEEEKRKNEIISSFIKVNQGSTRVIDMSIYLSGDVPLEYGIIMRSFFRMVLGTMRSMGVFITDTNG